MVLEGSSMPPSPLQIYTSPDPSQLPLGFGGSGQLREYNLDSNNPVVSLMNLNVANVTKILSFSYVDQYALLRLEDGSTELLNTTTGQPINLPMMDDLTITSVLPTNSAGTFGILYTDSNSSVFCVYNMSSNAALAGMSLSSIPSNIALTQEGVGYNLVVTDNSGITSYALIGHNVQTTLSYPIQNITWVGSILTNNGLLVYSTQNYGNSSNPQLNLVLTPVPDSPMFHHDASHTGYSVSTVPVTNQLLWHYATGGVVSSSPAIAGGIAYVGSSDGNIYALDATTGVPMWNYTTGGTVRSSPAVDDGMVFVSSDDGYTYDFNAQTGTLQWKSMTGGGQSSPAVANGVVYVGSSNDTVVALSETTGDILWTYTTSGIVNSSPAVSGGMVYVGSHDHNVYALNATTGACVWSYTTGGPVPSSPAVAGGIVYVGSDDWNVYALNAATGAYIWSVYVYGSVPCSPAVANGVVYVGSEDHRVYALNATTGSALWTYLTGAGIGFSSPTVASGIVFIGSEDDKLIALNATMGSLIWSYSTNGYLESTPAVADGNVYVGSNDGNIYAFGLFSVTLTYESSWMALNQPQTFISTVSGGAGTCYYQWYLDGSPASGATDPTYTFTLTSSGVHTVYVIVTDSAGIQTTSNVVNIYVPASEGVSKGGGGGTHPLTLWC
jgi:outer membrane protein assembly factor BamB